MVQFNVEVGSNGGTTTLGEKVTQTSINNLSTGPLYQAYVTVAPKGSPVTVSAGMMASLEGYEGGLDWNNPVQLTTALFFVQNQNSRGVSLNYTKGPLSATVNYGDGYNTGVFNFLQALITYTFNSSNVLNVYYGGNLGQTGLNAKTYGGTCGYGRSGLLRHGRDLWPAIRQFAADRRLLQLHDGQPEPGAGSAVSGRQGGCEARPLQRDQQFRRGFVRNLHVRQVALLARRLG